jgi:hypothetical protein
MTSERSYLDFGQHGQLFFFRDVEGKSVKLTVNGIHALKGMSRLC